MTSSDQSAEVSCPRFFAWRARLLRSSRRRRCLRLHFLSESIALSALSLLKSGNAMSMRISCIEMLQLHSKVKTTPKENHQKFVYIQATQNFALQCKILFLLTRNFAEKNVLKLEP